MGTCSVTVPSHHRFPCLLICPSAHRLFILLLDSLLSTAYVSGRAGDTGRTSSTFLPSGAQRVLPQSLPAGPVWTHLHGFRTSHTLRCPVCASDPLRHSRISPLAASWMFSTLHVIVALLLNADPATVRSSPTRFTGSVLLNTQRVLSRSRSRHRQARKSHVEPVLTNSRLVGVRPVRGIKRNPQCTSCVVSAALESLQ